MTAIPIMLMLNSSRAFNALHSADLDAASFDGIQCASTIQCRYHNQTELAQVLAISHPNWCFVKLLRPGQFLQFMAPSDACLTVKTGLTPSPLNTVAIPCRQLMLASHEDPDRRLSDFSAPRCGEI
jgi:hypothetical protein